MNPLLQVKDLRLSFTTYFSKNYVLRGVSFDLIPGETLAIVGESGSGKSMSAKALLRLLPESAKVEGGSILYQGNDIVSMREKEMGEIRGKEIGMIFQDPMTSLNPTMTIGDQIMESYLIHTPKASKREARKKALDLLHDVGIPQAETRLKQYPHELSGGMRQRVMIATVLAPSPKIIIADEPTTALDISIQAQILQLLKTIQQKTGTTIIFITHDLSIVAGFCSRVLVMYAGQVVEMGSVGDLFKKPKHPYTKQLLRSLPRLDQNQGDKLSPIKGSPPDLSIVTPGCSFFERCDKRLKICQNKAPLLFSLGNQSASACWLHDERAKPLKKEETPR